MTKVELRGRLLIAGEFVPGRMELEGGRITRIERGAEFGKGGSYFAPGLIDLHIHGYGGANPVWSLDAMAKALAHAGTTAFVPTTFPEAPHRLGQTCASIWKTAGDLNQGARVLGLHVEGPFVNPRKAGALNVADLAEPSLQALRDLLGPSSGDGRGIRVATVAPELLGCGDLIEELVRSGVRVSLGHSLASTEDARQAARRGAAGATHLYNAMTGVHHRDGGLATFALSDDALVSEIIGDLVHVGADAFALALRARGPEGLALVSDALEGAGTGCAVFESHGHRVVRDQGAFWIEELDEAGCLGPRTLTGAATTQWEAVQRLHAKGVCSLEDGLRMASETPARALGLEQEIGHLVQGARADLLEIDPQDLHLREVFVAGKAQLKGE